MSGDILKIALLCIVFGGASIPASFTINSSPIVVWLGNALGSLISALIVIFIGEHITNKKFTDRMNKLRMGKKIITVYSEGKDNQKIKRTRIIINKHGLRIFSFLCPIFPGVLISTAAVYILDLDKQLYKKWMLAGVFFASGIYVFGYWFIFAR